MLQFVIAGLVLGGIYAIASAGLVITYTSSGILNFAFGALAFFIARFYYYLHTQQSWRIVPAAVVSIVIAAPALGVVLYAVLFRYLRLAVAADQGGGDDRPLGRHPRPRHPHLRRPGHPAGPGAGARTGARLPLPRRAGDTGPGHRLHLRAWSPWWPGRWCCGTPTSASRCGPWSTRRR